MQLVKRVIFMTALSAMTANALAADESGDHAIGVGLNSFGGGFFYTYKLNDSINIRATLSGVDDDESEIEFSDIDYEGDIDSQSFGVMVDWYPLQSGWARDFFLSAGVINYDFEYSGGAKAFVGGSMSVGGNQFLASELNSLSVDIENSGTTPYLGIGWGNKVRKERGISLVAELGLFSVDSPDVTVLGSSVGGGLTSADLQREADDIESDLDGVGLFGGLNVSYHF